MKTGVSISFNPAELKIMFLYFIKPPGESVFPFQKGQTTVHGQGRVSASEGALFAKCLPTLGSTLDCLLTEQYI